MCMEFINHAKALGLIITSSSLSKEKWVRVHTETNSKKKNGAYFFGGDYGFIQNWETMQSSDLWYTSRTMTDEEKEKMRKDMEIAKKRQHEEMIKNQAIAAEKAKNLLASCIVDIHKYLAKKGFAEERANILKMESGVNLLVIPMRDFKGILVGIQMIDEEGNKKFLYGQRVDQCSFCFSNDNFGQTYLVEGYASGMSLKKILDKIGQKYRIHVCFSAGNILKMAKFHKDAIIFADNDKKSGTGQRIAGASGLKYWISDVDGEDINDFHMRNGDFKSSQLIKIALIQLKKGA